MSYDSPYQAMLENEVLYKQQPWLSRTPYQIGHALRPVGTTATGAGLGYGVGQLLGHPHLGAAIGGGLGAAYGVLAPSTTPAQDWAFNNPEKVHVLKARAAYDYGSEMEPKMAALRHFGLAAK